MTFLRVLLPLLRFVCTSAAFSGTEKLTHIAEVTSATAWALAGAINEPPTGGSIDERPKINPDWVADVRINRTAYGHQTELNGAGILAQEMSQQRRVLMTPQIIAIAPLSWVGTEKEWMNMSTFEIPNLIAVSFNGNAYPTPNPPLFVDLFSFLHVAKNAGEVTFKGRATDRWTFDLPLVHLEAFIDKAGVPVVMSQAVKVKGVEVYAVTYEFLTFRAGDKAPELWSNFNASHVKNPPRCPAPTSGTGNTTVTEMFIFHPKNNFNIAGQDVADLAGDTSFVCLDVMSNQTEWTDHNYTWLTKWEIEHLPVWGQYENCNGYPPDCLGNEKFVVGHEAPYYLGSKSSEPRQCGKNDEMGEWYSLPIAGECKDGSAPSEGVCSWRRSRRVKTIDGKCLINEHRFRDVCLRDARAPFADARKVFQAAFESDDIAQGGCPPIASEAFIV